MLNPNICKRVNIRKIKISVDNHNNTYVSGLCGKVWIDINALAFNLDTGEIYDILADKIIKKITGRYYLKFSIFSDKYYLTRDLY